MNSSSNKWKQTPSHKSHLSKFEFVYLIPFSWYDVTQCYIGPFVFYPKVLLLNINTLRLRHNGHHFADDQFNCIFVNENIWISINISLKLVPEGRINSIPTLVQIIPWRQLGDKPLSEPMIVSILTHICVAPQWVQSLYFFNKSFQFVNGIIYIALVQ